MHEQEEVEEVEARRRSNTSFDLTLLSTHLVRTPRAFAHHNQCTPPSNLPFLYFLLIFEWFFQADTHATDAGVDLFYGVDVWPIAPLVVRAQVAGGGIGQAGFGEAWGHVGVMWRYGEIFAGSRWLKIGSVEFAGPVLGIGAHW